MKGAMNTGNVREKEKGRKGEKERERDEWENPVYCPHTPSVCL